MRDVLVRLFSSTKFIMALLGMIAYVASRFGFDFSPEEAIIFVGPLIAAILGQGVADIGKPAAQINAAAAERIATGTATPGAPPAADGSVTP